ncbi:MAG: F0F1 ATP synthase subunit alpha, partial [Proteobacteria bacterium]|nr:F0F1 ATP synthase subunit alpha [Pseudomonadota bacterium]
EMAAFAQFSSDLDATTQRLLNRGARLTELLKQPQYAPLPFEEQTVAIYAGVKGYLDKVPAGDVTRYEQALLREMRGKGKDILTAIRNDADIKPEVDAKLKSFMEAFTKAFA